MKIKSQEPERRGLGSVRTGKSSQRNMSSRALKGVNLTSSRLLFVRQLGNLCHPLHPGKMWRLVEDRGFPTAETDVLPILLSSGT